MAMYNNPEWMFRMTHLPTGMIEERRAGIQPKSLWTLHKARADALRVLKARLAHPLPVQLPLVRTYNLIEETLEDHRSGAVVDLPCYACGWGKVFDAYATAGIAIKLDIGGRANG